MDIERVIMSCYKIQEQPDNIFNLIELALRVGAFKYQPKFEKRKSQDHQVPHESLNDIN